MQPQPFLVVEPAYHLKPVNVMVVADPDIPEGERVKVLDFGIAKLVAEAGDEELTRTGVSMGTPRYMSPEQCKSARNVTDRSDVYTLGLMLYELLCGQSPWDHIKSEVMVMAAQVSETPPALAGKAPETSPELGRLVERMLDKNPEARPSAAEVVLQLKRMAGGMSSTALPTAPAAPPPISDASVQFSPTLPALTRRSEGHTTLFQQLPRGGRAIVIAAAVTLLIGLIGIVLVVRSLLRAPDAPPAPTTIRWSIVSDPEGAEVVDDHGAVLGRTPLVHILPVGSGTSELTLRHSGFGERKITLSRSRDVDSNVALAPLPPAPPPAASEETTPSRKGGPKDKKKRSGKPR